MELILSDIAEVALLLSLQMSPFVSVSHPASLFLFLCLCFRSHLTCFPVSTYFSISFSSPILVSISLPLCPFVCTCVCVCVRLLDPDQAN